MEAAIKSIQKSGAGTIVIAVPVAPADTLKRLEPLVDQVVCLASPTPFYAVGQFFEQFGQTSDAKVVNLLEKSQVEQ